MLGGKLAYALYSYTRFDVSVPVTVTDWHVLETAPSEFHLSAEYTYFFKTKQSGTHLFQKPQYTNSFIAKKHLADFEKQQWRAYVNSKKPFVSCLQHNFPFKHCFHFFLGLGVLGYFIWLRSFIQIRYALD